MFSVSWFVIRLWWRCTIKIKRIRKVQDFLCHQNIIFLWLVFFSRALHRAYFRCKACKNVVSCFAEPRSPYFLFLFPRCGLSLHCFNCFCTLYFPDDTDIHWRNSATRESTVLKCLWKHGHLKSTLLNLPVTGKVLEEPLLTNSRASDSELNSNLEMLAFEGSWRKKKIQKAKLKSLRASCQYARHPTLSKELKALCAARYVLIYFVDSHARHMAGQTIFGNSFPIWHNNIYFFSVLFGI